MSEHPLTRLRTLTGRKVVDLATEVVEPAPGPHRAQVARNAWSRWLHGRRAPSLRQLARLAGIAEKAGDIGLAADLMRWALELGRSLAEEPTVVIAAADMEAMAAEDARLTSEAT